MYMYVVSFRGELVVLTYNIGAYDKRVSYHEHSEIEVHIKAKKKANLHICIN